MYKRMRFLVLAQRYGMRCQIALKKYQGRPSEKKLKGALLNILKTEDIYIDNNKIIARLKKY